VTEEKVYEVREADGLLFNGNFYASHVVTFASGRRESSGL
jgi:hypothetical protein